MTNRLLEVQTESKKLDEEKVKLRQLFFNLATKEIKATRKLGRKRVTAHVDSEAALLPHIMEQYPGWSIVEYEWETDRFEERWFIVLLEEDPAYLKFTYVNPKNQHVFTRQIAVVGEKFNAHDFYATTPYYHLVDMETVYTLNEERAKTFASQDPEVVSVLQKFTTPGKPQVKLGTPRKATVDDA